MLLLAPNGGNIDPRFESLESTATLSCCPRTSLDGKGTGTQDKVKLIGMKRLSKMKKITKKGEKPGLLNMPPSHVITYYLTVRPIDSIGEIVLANICGSAACRLCVEF
jgi:hypothetical protein